jgi:uncharacterized protein HemX
MAEKKPTISERITAVEAAVCSLSPKPTIWQRFRNHSLAYVSILLAAVALVVAYLAWWQPQWKEQAHKDLAQQIDNEIEAKLKEHKFDELVGDVRKCPEFRGK